MILTKVVLVGGNKIVHYLTKNLLSRGYEVIIVHPDKLFCEEMKSKHQVTTIWGNGADPEILEEVQACKDDIILALFQKDSDNLIVCQLAKKMFQIKSCIAYVQDPKNVEIFKMLGVETGISIASLIENLIHKRAAMSDMSNLMAIERGKVAMMEFEIQEHYPIVGQALSEINLTEDAVIGCIIRSQKAIIPRGDTRLYVGDKVLILTLPNVQHIVKESICGKD